MIKPAALPNYNFSRCRGQFYGNKRVFREKWYGCKAVLRGILLEAILVLMRYRRCRSTAAVLAYSLAGVHTVSGQSALTSAKDVTIVCHGGTAAVVWMSSTKKE